MIQERTVPMYNREVIFTPCIFELGKDVLDYFRMGIFRKSVFVWKLLFWGWKAFFFFGHTRYGNLINYVPIHVNISLWKNVDKKFQTEKTQKGGNFIFQLFGWFIFLRRYIYDQFKKGIVLYLESFFRKIGFRVKRKENSHLLVWKYFFFCTGNIGRENLKNSVPINKCKYISETSCAQEILNRKKEKKFNLNVLRVIFY
jgi:hypothetical protein